MRDNRGASFAREATFTDPQRDRLRANPEWPGSGASVIVLLGGDDYFSNGINLAVIEAAEDRPRSPGATWSRSTIWCAK